MIKIDIYTINFLTITDCLSQLKLDLSPDELERASRFIHEKDARSYIISHAYLRRILAEHLACKPLDLMFEKNAQGKPFLPDTRIQFNLSHSGDYALIALSDAPVGIDIERHKPARDVLAIAQRYFTPTEYLYIKNQDDQNKTSTFYDVWSAKEAYVKALGEGIAYGFDRFSVINLEGEFVTAIENQSLSRLQVADGYSAAVAGSATKIISY